MDQLALPMNIIAQAEVDGIEFGVLADGTSYMTGRGLARACGVEPSNISKETKAWEEGKRSSGLAQTLTKLGIARESLYIPTSVTGVQANAYPEDVCMGFLEYYAFEARSPVPEALKRYRVLAQAGMRLFVYKVTGYDPTAKVPSPWKQFQDRLLLNKPPVGYFSVFAEMSSFVVDAIRCGLIVDDHTVPDISVGTMWSKYWVSSGLENDHPVRRKHPHVYPEYFPQAAANDIIEAWVYPLTALGEFRMWCEQEYVPFKFPKYLEYKVKTKKLAVEAAKLIVKTLVTPELPDDPKKR